MLIINPGLVEHLQLVAEKSLEYLTSLKMKSMGVEKIPGSINQAITNKVIEFSMLAERKFDTYDLFTELYIMILMGHLLTNGNKRFALVFLVIVMETFGFIIWTQKGITVKKIKDLIVSLEGNKVTKKDPGYKKIKKYLIASSMDNIYEMKFINKAMTGKDTNLLTYPLKKHFYTSERVSSKFLLLIRELDKH